MKNLSIIFCTVMISLSCSILATTGGCGDSSGGGSGSYSQSDYAPAGPGGNRWQPRDSSSGQWQKTTPERPTVYRQ